jgi:hypothetical protein
MNANQNQGPKSGTRYKRPDGYVVVWMPEHPSTRNRPSKYVLEHRLVMESVLGRYLSPTEVVHHKDRNKSNNDPSNLELGRSNTEHLMEELAGRVYGCPAEDLPVRKKPTK